MQNRIRAHSKVIGLTILSALVLSGFTLPRDSRIIRHLVPPLLLCTGYYDPILAACLTALSIAASPPENPPSSDATGEEVEHFQVSQLSVGKIVR